MPLCTFLNIPWNRDYKIEKWYYLEILKNNKQCFSKYSQIIFFYSAYYVRHHVQTRISICTSIIYANELSVFAFTSISNSDKQQEKIFESQSHDIQLHWKTAFLAHLSSSSSRLFIFLKMSKMPPFCSKFNA